MPAGHLSGSAGTTRNVGGAEGAHFEAAVRHPDTSSHKTLQTTWLRRYNVPEAWSLGAIYEINPI